MPSKSAKQARMMAAAAHNPAFAKKVGVPVSVAKEFNQADKGRKFGSGGMTEHDDVKEDKRLIKKAFGMHDKQLHESKKTDLSKLKKGGSTMAIKKVAGKETMGPKSMSKDVEKGKSLKFGEHGEQKRGHTKGKNLGDSGSTKGIMGDKVKKMARGGGIESKGHTKGKMITMCGGGMKGKK
jgi:hypothetical protein